MPYDQNSVVNQYQSILGRAPTGEELSSFKSYMNTGGVDLTPMDVGNIIRSTPEYQNQQLQGQTSQLSNVLGASDQRILGMAQQDTMGQFAGMGRMGGGGSSAYVNAFAQAAQNLATNRQQQIASFLGSGLQGIQGLTQQQGANSLAFGQGQQAGTLDFSRSMELSQYMQNNFNSYLNQQNRQNRNAALGSAALGIGGALVGGWAGGGLGTAGGRTGAMLGGGIGSNAGGLFR